MYLYWDGPLYIFRGHSLGLLRVSEYLDIRGSEFKIEYEYLSLPKPLDCDLFFFKLKKRSFSQKGQLNFFSMTIRTIDDISHLNTFVSRRLVTYFIGN